VASLNPSYSCLFGQTSLAGKEAEGRITGARKFETSAMSKIDIRPIPE